MALVSLILFASSFDDVLLMMIFKVKLLFLSMEFGGFEDSDITAVSSEGGGVASSSPCCFGVRCWCCSAKSSGSEYHI